MRKSIRSITFQPSFPVILLFILSAGAPKSYAQNGSPVVSANIEEYNSVQQRRPETNDAETPVRIVPEDYSSALLAPGYRLSMTVMDLPQYSDSFRINGSGDVDLPVIGPVHLAGLTLTEAQHKLVNVYQARKVLNNPVLTLRILEFSAPSVSVLGEVLTPGRYSFISPHSLPEVLAFAGGETIAAGSQIEIQHADANGKRDTKVVHYRQNDPIASIQNEMIFPGDSVFVKRTGVIYVLGAVAHGGGYLMADGGTLSVYEALSLAGGTVLNASDNGMYIIRPKGATYDMIPVPLSKLKSWPRQKSQLQADDVLYVPRSNVKVALLDGATILGAAINGLLYYGRP